MIKRFFSIFLLAVATTSFAGIASAQSNGNASQQNTQQLMQQYRDKASQLQKIHQKTIENQPKLAAEQKAFEKQVRKAIKKQGYDVNKGEQRLQKMAAVLKSGDLSDSERKSTMKDLQAERAKLIKARNAALKQPEIRKSIKQLQHDTVAAMQKQNSHTTQLIAELKTLRQQLRSATAPQASHNN